MAVQPEALVLEIHWNRDHLTMSVGSRDPAAETIRHYTRRPVTLSVISEISRETSRLLAAVRDSRMDPPALEAFKKNGLMLWDQLFTPPVKAALRASPQAELSILLDEELACIPWELVFDGSEFLCLKFNLGRLIATRSQKPPPARPMDGRLKMLVLANPTGDLCAAYDEGLFIRRTFEKKRRGMAIDFKSTAIDSLYVKRSLREYDIVHFAGHCEYETGDSAETGWVLADSRFTCGDVLALGGEHALPSLIFSHCCHSARVANEDPDDNYETKTYSLASAFLFAGVRHYLGTLHRFPDASGPVFSGEFYTRFFAGGTIGEAVRRARLAAAGKDFAGSASWATYILYGDPGYVLPEAPIEAAPARGRIELKPRKRVFVLSALAAVLIFAGGIYLAPQERLLLRSAENLIKAGRNKEAVAVCARLVKGSRAPAARLVMGDALARLGRREEAIKSYFDYILDFGGRYPQRAAQTCIKIGWLYQEYGDYAKAVEFYERALSESRDRKDMLGESSALRKLAVWNMDKGDNNKALELLTKSLEIDRERQSLPDHRYNLACDYFDMGLLFSNKDENDTAAEFYRKSKSLFEQLHMESEESDYYFNTGEIMVSEKQYQRALENYLKGLKMDTESGNVPSIAADYNMIGEFYVAINRPEMAQEYFQRSMELAGRIGARPTLASASYNLGMFYRKKGDRARAREYMVRAFRMYGEMGLPDAEDAGRQLKEME
jgi:tetratricopeptide (TPR) repeat protein/CHAT domain-containing protein